MMFLGKVNQERVIRWVLVSADEKLNRLINVLSDNVGCFVLGRTHQMSARAAPQ